MTGLLSESLLPPEEEYEYLTTSGKLPETTLMLPSGYLSVSQVNTYLRCPKQYEFRYVKGVIAPPQARMAEGTAIHKALETAHRERLVSQSMAPLDVLTDAHNDCWKDVKRHIEIWDEDSPEEKILKRARIFLNEYHKRFLPYIQPIGVEKRFWTVIGEQNIPILGFIDLIAEDTNPVIRKTDESEREVIDYKVVSKRIPQSEADGSVQLTVYAHATGIPRVRFDSFIKTKAPSIQAVTSFRTSRDWNWAKHLFTEIGKAVATGIFPPTLPTAWTCSQSWCGYYDRCRGGF